MDRDFKIKRKRGGFVDPLSSEDGLFDHILRGDLRRTYVHRVLTANKRPRIEFTGVREKGIVYKATVELSRAEYEKQKGSLHYQPQKSELKK